MKLKNDTEDSFLTEFLDSIINMKPLKSILINRNLVDGSNIKEHNTTKNNKLVSLVKEVKALDISEINEVLDRLNKQNKSDE